MNKFLLLGAASILSVGVNAQTAKRIPTRLSADGKQLQFSASFLSGKTGANSAALNSLHKAAAVTLFSEPFANGIPAGWTAQSLGGTSASWKWAKAATTGDYGLGALRSTTSANGWMVYDSDSIGKLTPSLTPLEGTLTSPAYNLTGEPLVEVTFQQYYRRFKDSCFLEVSTNNFTTYTRYSIQPNNDLRNNGSTENGQLARINVSQVAGGQANVRFRFRYIGLEAGGSYNWLLDDFAINRGSQTDMGINRVYHMMTLADPSRGMTYFGDYPRQLLDTVYAHTEISNYGSGAQTGASVSLNITNTATTPPSVVLNQNVTLPSFALNEQFTDKGSTNGGIPSAIGLHRVVATVSATGDGDMSNNTDTSYFRITDTVLSSSPYNISSGYYLSRPPSGSSAGKNTVGIVFDIPSGKSDTVTGFSVAFHPQTNVSSMGSGTLNVQLYSYDASGNITPILTSADRKLTAADLSSATQTKYVYFPTYYTLGGAQTDFVIGSGSYVAAVQLNGLPASATAIIGSTVSDAPVEKFLPGLLTKSNNTGGLDFGASTAQDRSSLDMVPMIRVHFGNDANSKLLSVKETAAITLSPAHPNPANSTFNVPVTLKTASEVSVTLTNPMGQVVATQNLGKVAAGQTATAVFNTSALANGVYFYTVEAGGERTTERMVVAH